MSTEENEIFAHAMSMVNCFSLPTVFTTAMELNVFKIINELSKDDGGGGGASPLEISSRLQTENPEAASMVDRMLHLLANYSLLTCSVRTSEGGLVERVYGIGPVSKFFLTEQDGGSLAYLSFLNSHAAHAKARSSLKDAVLEGGVPFEKAHADIDPRFSSIFNKAMASHSIIILKKILETYKGFEGLNSLVDVGGGDGSTLNMIINKYPSIRGINYDLPHVIQHLLPSLGIENIEGNMFEAVPKGDAVLLKFFSSKKRCGASMAGSELFQKWSNFRDSPTFLSTSVLYEEICGSWATLLKLIELQSICHNWNDEQCVTLLKNCYKALPETGKVIIIDPLMPEAAETNFTGKLVAELDITMLISLGGRERTEREFAALSKAAGFSCLKVVSCVYAHSILDVHK
ncbi:Plant methyltransferase dimerization [Dillenia turbinata]|uniref:Plant methyltransferase dimerization n=1 Tax=Dillenia turbinata TaxID=194707 RepID=A0AAN8UI42_9MAGN